MKINSTAFDTQNKDSRPKLLKDANPRQQKANPAEEFARKSKEGALRHSKDANQQNPRDRKPLYWSSSKDFMNETSSAQPTSTNCVSKSCSC